MKYAIVQVYVPVGEDPHVLRPCFDIKLSGFTSLEEAVNRRDLDYKDDTVFIVIPYA